MPVKELSIMSEKVKQKTKKSPDNIRESPDYRIGIMGTIQSSISELDAYL